MPNFLHQISADSEMSFREYSSSSSNEYDSSLSSEDYELFADCKSKLNK